MQARTEWVDYAKAIGIILVVYGHVARGLFDAGIDVPVHTYQLLDSIIYSFHMPLFFFLSGLFFKSSLTRRGSAGLIFNKLDTIIYPYLLWSIAQGLTEVYLSNYTNGSTSLTQVFSLWVPRAHFWFLYALFLVFITSIILYRLTPSAIKPLIIVVSALVYLYGLPLPANPAIIYISSNLVFFVLGISYTDLNLHEKLSTYSALATTSLLFIIAQYAYHGTLELTYTDRGYLSIALAVISILFICSLSSILARHPSAILKSIGAASMAIYLLHIFAGSGLRIALMSFNQNSMVLHLIAGILASILLPMLALTVINQMKIQYMFSAPISAPLRWLYRQVPQPQSKS